MWDYSLLFGRYLYDYPLDQGIPATTDTGRQLVGGLPFIVPGVTIVVERFWTALTTVLPYLLLGLAAFRFTAKDKKLWFLLGLWSFILLKQGPIHPPLVLFAFAVALLWRRPLWVSIPLIIITSYLAEESRYTWMFAPGLWLVMLEFSGARLQDGRLRASTWRRAIALGLAGAIGGFYGSAIWRWLQAAWKSMVTTSRCPCSCVLAFGAFCQCGFCDICGYSTSLVVVSAFSKCDLWHGILLALLIAVAPTISLVLYLLSTRKWMLNTWQKLALVFPLLAFLTVGVIVSTKIGGGGDLHNMDMFLIGILFVAVIAWENGGRQWLREIDASPIWVKSVLVLLLIIPGIQPLSALRSYRFAEDATWLVTLTDVSNEKFLEMLPAQDEVDDIMQDIEREVALAKPEGRNPFYGSTPTVDL